MSHNPSPLPQQMDTLKKQAEEIIAPAMATYFGSSEFEDLLGKVVEKKEKAVRSSTTTRPSAGIQLAMKKSSTSTNAYPKSEKKQAVVQTSSSEE